jgi:hypothetical protein
VILEGLNIPGKLAAASRFEPLHRSKKTKKHQVIGSEKKPGKLGFFYLGNVTSFAVVEGESPLTTLAVENRGGNFKRES